METIDFLQLAWLLMGSLRAYGLRVVGSGMIGMMVFVCGVVVLKRRRKKDTVCYIERYCDTVAAKKAKKIPTPCILSNEASSTPPLTLYLTRFISNDGNYTISWPFLLARPSLERINCHYIISDFRTVSEKFRIFVHCLVLVAILLS